MKSLCCEKCLDCKYYDAYDKFCEYILKTKHPRPCPAGEQCIVFERRETDE